MNSKASDSSKNNPVELDTVFQPPERSSWIELAVSGLGENATIDTLQTQTLDGIPIQSLYDSIEQIPQIPATEKQTLWDNRFSLSADYPATAKRDIMSSLDGGATSIELHIHESASLDELLADVQLSVAPISLRAGMDYKPRCEELLSIAQTQGVKIESLRCSFNADPLGHALAVGGLSKSIEDAMSEMAEFSATTYSQSQHCSCVLVDVAIHHNAGATPVQELHAAIATATMYLEYLIDAGMSIEAAQHTIVFQIAMDSDTLLGVAKLRALQALWQHVVHSIGNSSNEALTTPASVVAETSHRYLSIRDTWNNHLRNLSAGMAACMAGANTLIVHRHDRLTNDSDATLGQRMARNIPIILERECGLRKVSDPLGGSYAIENLTHQLMQRVWASLSDTESSSGWLSEIQNGRWQRELSAAHAQRIEQLESGQVVAVGVNQFVQHQNLTNEHTALIDTETKCDTETPLVWPVEPLPVVRDAHSFEPGNSDVGSKS